MTGDERTGASLRAWLDGQEPPRSSERVAAAVIEEVARTNQGRAPVVMGVLPALGAAAVIIGLIILAGLELRPPVGPTPTVAPATHGPTIDRGRLPAGAAVIDVGSATWGNVGMLVVADERGTVWVRDEGTHLTNIEFTRIDPATDAANVIAVGNALDLAGGGNDLWALMGDQPIACCDPAPLVQLDPTTGAVLRTIDSAVGFELALDDGTAWVTDERSLFHVDLASGELLATIDVPDGPSEPIEFDGVVWLSCGCGDASLVRVDPARGAVTGMLAIPGLDGIAAGEGAIWAKTDGGLIEQQGGPPDSQSQLLRIDPVTMDVVATLDGFGRGVSFGTLVVSHGYLWTPGVGELLRIDPRDNSVAVASILPWGTFPGMAVVGDELWMVIADAGKVIHFPLPLP